jgi:hypothetical protein
VRPTRITGPLRPHAGNPLCFADRTGKPVYLAGHQIFVDLQDHSWARLNMPDGAPTLDWAWYLDYAQAHYFNYLRNWILWSSSPSYWNPSNGSSPTTGRWRTAPMLFLRTGPGLALDGLPKFDLDRLDPAFFARLRRRVDDARKRGIFVSVMLFELFGFLANEATYPNTLWAGNMFHAPNNINGIEADANGDRNGFEFFTLRDERIVERQKTYIRKVVATLASADNVLWEICNEPPNSPETVAWLKEMVRYLRACESHQPKRHMILMTPGGQIPGGGFGWMSKEDVFSTHPDSYTVARGWGAFREGDPPPASTLSATLPAIFDLDHVWPGSASPSLAWEALTRGYAGFSLYDQPFENQPDESPDWELARHNIAATRRYAERFADLSRARARGDLCSTAFCLADPGADYLIYLPRGGRVTVDLSAVSGPAAVEWFRPATCDTTPAPDATGGAKQEFEAPFDGPAVLYVTAISKRIIHPSTGTEPEARRRGRRRADPPDPRIDR